MTWINHPSRSTEEQRSGCFAKWSCKGKTVLPAHAMKTPLSQSCAAKEQVCSYTRDPDGAPGYVFTGTPPPLAAAAEGSQCHTTGGKRQRVVSGEEGMNSHSDPRDRFLLLLPSSMFQCPALLCDHVIFHIHSLRLGAGFFPGMSPSPHSEGSWP